MNTTTRRPEWTDREIGQIRALVGKYGLDRVVRLIGELAIDGNNPNAGRFLCTTAGRPILLPFEQRREKNRQVRLMNSR